MNRRIILSSITALICAVTAAAQQSSQVISYLEIYDTETDTHHVVKEFPFLIEAPNWTPDGEWLVVNKNGRLYKVAPDGSTDLIEINTGSINQCNNDHVISADGKWIALSSNDPANRWWNSYVYKVPFEGGEPVKITPEGPSYLHGISPDGKTIAYCAFRGPDGEQDVYAMPVKGGKEVRLTDAPGLDDGPEYSMDGKHIWFNSVRTGRMQVWRMKANGKDQKQMTFDTDMNSWFPHISPDGEKVVYIAYHDYEIDPGDHLANLNVQLRMIPAEGGEPKVLVELFGGQGTINVNSWSPDSKKFAYVSYRLAEEITAPQHEMAVQLYSARSLIGTPELFAQNHRYVLQRMAQMGYTGVEAASYDGGKFSGMEPEAFRKTINEAGLELISSHTTRMLSPDELASGDISKALEWWDACIMAHKKAGIPRLVMSYAQKLSAESDLKVMADYLNAIGAKCNEAGIRFGYHNHDHEFHKAGNTTMMDYFIQNTLPENVFIEMDVYWAVAGGAAPVEYMQKYPGRFEVLHIKDKREIGQSGMVGFDAIFRNFDKAGTTAFVVEMEEATTPNILRGLRESALYLRNNLPQDVQVLPIQDNASERKMARQLFPDVPDQLFETLGLQDGIPSSVCAFLVKTGAGNILFDAANGTPDSRLMPLLDSYGVSPDDVDVIFITHMHGDHVGGLMKDGAAVFKNAELYINKVEYDAWMAMPEGQSAQLRAIAQAYGGRLKTFSVTDALPYGVKAVGAYGHTPGHTAYIIGDNIIVGDIMHGLALQLENPQYSARFDMDKDQAVDCRKAIIKMAGELGMKVYGMHFPSPYYIDL